MLLFNTFSKLNLLITNLLDGRSAFLLMTTKFNIALASCMAMWMACPVQLSYPPPLLTFPLIL